MDLGEVARFSATYCSVYFIVYSESFGSSDVPVVDVLIFTSYPNLRVIEKDWQFYFLKITQTSGFGLLLELFDPFVMCTFVRDLHSCPIFPGRDRFLKALFHVSVSICVYVCLAL